MFIYLSFVYGTTCNKSILQREYVIIQKLYVIFYLFMLFKYLYYNNKKKQWLQFLSAMATKNTVMGKKDTKTWFWQLKNELKLIIKQNNNNNNNKLK